MVERLDGFVAIARLDRRGRPGRAGAEERRGGGEERHQGPGRVGRVVIEVRPPRVGSAACIGFRERVDEVLRPKRERVVD